MRADESLFRREDDLFVPTDAAGNPWGELTGGGPIAGLIARAVENTLDEPDLFVARLTVDLHRPVPRNGLAVATRTVRAGKRLRVVEITLSQGDTEVTRATAHVLRRSELDGEPEIERTPFAGPTDVAETSLLPDGLGLRWGVHDVVQVRWVRDQFAGSPSQAWMRIPLPLVDGERTSPLCQVAILVDCISAGSPIGTLFGPWINSDITLYLHREPIGEWLGMEMERNVEPTGIGVARARLFDERGPVGTAHEAVLAHRLG
ncbi:thioesterase family protein [Saccharopolyspora gloriosae]|uniref:thioesterase family protein n=1 Tax=Saccharopolyspora gloriosae TaxID=455344 RepID=UPI001FB6BDD1|nr:thioesterase family protein [Saccharopolyspora gloriosae]